MEKLLILNDQLYSTEGHFSELFLMNPKFLGLQMDELKLLSHWVTEWFKSLNTVTHVEHFFKSRQFRRMFVVVCARMFCIVF